MSTQTKYIRNRGLGTTVALEVIDGKKNSVKVPLSPAIRESIANRFMNYGASLATLAWETGWSQHTLCECIVEIARAEGIRVGVNKGRFERSLGVAA